MSESRKRLTLTERWAADEELLADAPLQLDADPRWLTDDLPQYGPNAPEQRSPDDLDEDEL